MVAYAFPAVFHPNEDGTYTVTFPDLPGCITEGKSLQNSFYMARATLTQWLEYLTDSGQEIPLASSAAEINLCEGEYVNLIRVVLYSPGVAESIRFLQQFDSGSGDYTKEKYERPEMTPEEAEALMDAMQQEIKDSKQWIR